MKSGPRLIDESNVSHAWARAFLELARPAVASIEPLVVTVHAHDGALAEDIAIRRILDCALRQNGKHTCDTVASTIFPQSLWNPSRPRSVLYDRYRQALRRLRRHPENRLGMYFERMIMFSDDSDHANQLEHVIEAYQAGVRRRSAFQVALLDPRRDHTLQRQRGFPCLHQVAFTPYDGGLSVTGFYATQYLFDRAYGNYLGLGNLGCFIAREIGLELRSVTCVAATGRLGTIRSTGARRLADQIREVIPNRGETDVA